MNYSITTTVSNAASTAIPTVAIMRSLLNCE